MKLMTLLAVSALIIMCLQGCAVQKQLTPTGGSRADGTVKMSYECGAYEVPKVDAQQGWRDAKRRCQSWGYEDAEAFGGFTRSCIYSSGSGCSRWLVTHEYQCTGTPTASK
jgi:hypothetical protein